MDTLNLDIVESVTAKRKPKKILIPKEYFDSLHSSQNKLKVMNVVEWPGRMISSGVVTRQNLLNTQIKPSPVQQPVTESIVKDNDEEPLYFKLPPKSSRMDRLRTPYARKSSAQIAKRNCMDENLAMTRNCAQVFSQMMQDYRPDTPRAVDPSQSVQRIVRGSGVLKTFGTGFLKDDDVVHVDEPLEMTPGSLSISRITAGENVSALQVICVPTIEKSALELLTGDEQVVPGTNKKRKIVRSEDLLVDGSLGSRTISEADGRVARNGQTFLKDFELNLKALKGNIAVQRGQERNRGVSLEKEESLDQNISSSQQSYRSYSSAPYTAHITENNGDKYETLVLQETYEMEMVQYLPFPRVNDAIKRSMQYSKGSTSGSNSSTSSSPCVSEDGDKSETTETSSRYAPKDLEVQRETDAENTGSGYEPSASSSSSQQSA